MSAPTPPPPDGNAPLSDAARERERDRLLTLANVQRMRGQLAEAQATLKQALSLAGGSPEADAPVHELLGDVLAADEKWEEAKAAYNTAHTLQASRASAERKFAHMALRTAEAAREREMAEAALRGELPADRGGGPRGKRSPGMAMLLSALVPGFGQFYNGQLTKGLVCLGAFLLALIAIGLSPDGDLLVKQILGLIVLRPVPGARGDVSPLLWLLVLVSGVVWLYGVLDAPITASRLSREVRSDGGTTVDKSGWEV